MQLKQSPADTCDRTRNGQIRIALATATCALLGATAPGALHAQGAADEQWDVDSALMIYSETDRVTAVEPVVKMHRQLDDDNEVDVTVVLDTLTGASPNGATPSADVQTFTRPSGRGEYRVAPGETPLDDTFQDTRLSLGGVWTRALSRFTRRSLGATVSREYDFTSLAASASWARDFDNRNRTLSLGLGVEYDLIEPEGGIPVPFASMAPAGAVQPRQGSDETRTVVDLLFGLTQVVNRRTLMQFNYSISSADGYLSDPFKILSVIDDAPGAGLGDTVDYVYENRPDSRLKQSLYWQTKYHLSEDVIDFSYRYLWDDWEISSHTFDLRYRYMLDGGSYLEPHLRLYRQEAAEFYRYNLLASEATPTFASADPRLGEFTGTTIGLKYSLPLSDAQRISLRGEIYRQDGDGSPDSAIGSQRGLDLFPDLEAWILQVGYSFRW